MRYVLRNGELVSKASAPNPARSSLPCPAIRSDGMGALVSMADGRTYDSKSAYYASVKNAGCEIVDSPSDFGPAPTYEPSGVAASIARACEEHGL